MRNITRKALLAVGVTLIAGIAVPTGANAVAGQGVASGEARSSLAVVAPTGKGYDARRGQGTLRLRIIAPEGVPASVSIRGKYFRLATKAAAGTSSTTSFSLPAGDYDITPEDSTREGRLYTGSTRRTDIRLTGRNTTDVTVVYRQVSGVENLHVEKVDSSSITLGWSVPSDPAAKGKADPPKQFVLRRARGAHPVDDPRRGLGVGIDGTTATDTGLDAGKSYSYSLFWRAGRGWSGPLTLVVGTSPATGSTQAAYTLAPGTLLAAAGDIGQVTTTGLGVTVVFKQPKTLPPGAAVVLPISPTLAGGFLGKVTAVSPDGTRIDLGPGALSDAFDYYSLDVPTFSFTVPGETSTGSSAPSATTSSTVTKVAQSAAVTTAATQAVSEDPGPFAPGERKPLTEEQAQQTAVGSGISPAAAKAAAPLNAVAASCSASAGVEVTFTPTIAVDGHFKAKLDKAKVLGVDLPKGASVDMAATATATGAAAVKASSKGSCTVSLKEAYFQLSSGPVPLGMTFKPQASVSYDASLELSNVGVEVAVGFNLAGTLSITGDAKFSGGTTLKATPLTPKVTSKGSVGLRLDGDLVVGPGAGTSNAGVLVGVGGLLSPIDASFTPVFTATSSDSTECLKAEAKATLDLSVQAKAWLGSWSKDEAIQVDSLDQALPYPGSPWTLPKDCDKPTSNPSDNVLGGGVTKVSDGVVGDAAQVGYVSGFVPNKTTWVLSTGKVSDAVGAPSTFASTSLGLPGDDDLAALAGHATYDAVAYNVTVVPSGKTLHVRYVFASEEYPEYVGSTFNDVMEVLVNGVNCATVPGTSSSPVSVNSVNAGTNSAYFVDNTTGASGYGTSMDGLTVPLECSVPVTPGVATTVQIKVADSSDRVYDSAVALLDKGIWAD
jgi:hypothetical protein